MRVIAGQLSELPEVEVGGLRKRGGISLPLQSYSSVIYQAEADGTASVKKIILLRKHDWIAIECASDRYALRLVSPIR